MITMIRAMYEAKDFVIKERIIECINIAHCFAWAAVFLADPRMMVHFNGFSTLSGAYGAVFVFLLLMTLWGLFNRHVAAIAMSLSASLWAVMSVKFWLSFPPANEGMFYYPVLTILTYAMAQVIEKECKKKCK